MLPQSSSSPAIGRVRNHYDNDQFKMVVYRKYPLDFPHLKIVILCNTGLQISWPQTGAGSAVISRRSAATSTRNKK